MMDWLKTAVVILCAACLMAAISAFGSMRVTAFLPVLLTCLVGLVAGGMGMVGTVLAVTSIARRSGSSEGRGLFAGYVLGLLVGAPICVGAALYALSRLSHQL